jgi:hypothetical protein
VGGFIKRRELKVSSETFSPMEDSIYTTTLLDEVDAINLSYETDMDLNNAIQYHVASPVKSARNNFPSTNILTD